MYLRFYNSYDTAHTQMKTKNRTHNRGDKKLFVVVEHPPVDGSGQWAVMDLESAVDSGFIYKWTV